MSIKSRRDMRRKMPAKSHAMPSVKSKDCDMTIGMANKMAHKPGKMGKKAMKKIMGSGY